MAKVTGIGGVFFKVADPAATRAWYREMLGIDATEWGAMFRHEGPEALTIWNPFKATTDYFEPSPSPFMINFRVDDLDAFIADLAAKGVEPLGRMDESYGKFAWLMDPDGLKIELWEQIGGPP